MILRQVGSNQTELSFNNGTTLFFSYETPVAGFSPDLGHFKTETYYSRTTSKHINPDVYGNKSKRAVDWICGPTHEIRQQHIPGYTGQCRGFVNKDFMSKLVLNNNGMSDESFAHLLTGLQCMETISVLDLRKNTIGAKSVRLMSDFFVRGFPRHLQVLRLVDCKMDHPSTFMLLKMLRQKSNLRTLALVGASFDEKNENELVKYLKENNTLKELDLSWNEISQKAIVNILKQLVENNNLLMLNLSHNVLI